MASCEELPVELKEAIILELSPRDLNNLSKTCKSLRVVALPAMFRRIEFTWDAKAADGPAITALLRSILETPALGKNIKDLTLQAVNYRGFRAPGFNGDILLPGHTHRIPAPDWEMFEKALEACPCEEKGECDDTTTREGNLNAGIAVLISYCTRLESLQMDIQLLMNNYRLPAMLRSTLYRTLGPWGKQSWFEKLTQVTITQGYGPLEKEALFHVTEQYATNLPVPTDTFLALFYLPAVKTLDITLFPNVDASEGLQKDSGRHTVWPFPQAPLALWLTTLRICRSPALPATLDLLLQVTPNLTTLDYDLFTPASKAPICLDTLRQALERVRRTLKHLTIKLDVFGDDYGVDDDEFDTPAEDMGVVCRGALGSLREFDALLTLKASLPALYGQVHAFDPSSLANILPPNLQRLVITDDMWNFMAFLWTDIHLLRLLRKFITGEKKHKEWWDQAARLPEISFIADTEPLWKTATPHLSELVVDFERADGENEGFLLRPEQRNLFKKLCREQGISCEILYYDVNKVLRKHLSSDVESSGVELLE